MKTEAHQWNPADYARHSQGQERWARELFQLLAPKPDESILDVGCGDGRNTAALANLVPQGRVVGVDRSPEMVAYAQDHFPQSQFPNLTFLKADASALPFHAEFDAIFSNAVLHWVLDHRPVLAGIARSLRPGGRCVLQMGGKGNGDQVVAVMEACLADPKWQAEWRPSEAHYGFHSVDEYRQWMREAGLHPDSVELIEKDMVHETAAAFTGWLRTAWQPYTTRVAAERREPFLDAVTEQYLIAHPADASGRVHVRMVRLQALAHKPR
jgi:trans-aconitate methyltransferase